MVFAPWTSVVSTKEASEQFPGQVDPNWRAAAVYHGRPHEWPLGTIGQNPVGFSMCAVALGLGIGGWAYCAFRTWRLQRDAPRRTDGRVLESPT
jgi:hypothetical protein